MEQQGASPDCIPNVYAFPVQLKCDFLEQKSMAELAKAQKNYIVLRKVIEESVEERGMAYRRESEF